MLSSRSKSRKTGFGGSAMCQRIAVARDGSNVVSAQETRRRTLRGPEDDGSLRMSADSLAIPLL